MPLAVWKHEATRTGGRTYLTPGPAAPPPPDATTLYYDYTVVSWACWADARDFEVGERIEVEMEYTPISRDGTVWQHCFYRREFDLDVTLTNYMTTWQTPRLVISHRHNPRRSEPT
jgi:hypothetical protein